MAKKNANNAIDFTRLLAIKDQLPTISRPLPAEPERAANVSLEEPQPVPTSFNGTVLDFPQRELVADPPTAALETQGSDPELASPPWGEELPPAEVATSADLDQTVILRIGMSRSLHERVKASAALEGKSPAHLARELMSLRTPLFPRSTSMAQLAKQARESFPLNDSRVRVDVRMQVPIDLDLHRRLRQLAALRAQTLVACTFDLFESAVPVM